jgi:4-amino-4-deoxy-L-arabinose transferase-like glycosyltransferase
MIRQQHWLYVERFLAAGWLLILSSLMMALTLYLHGQPSFPVALFILLWLLALGLFLGACWLLDRGQAHPRMLAIGWDRQDTSLLLLATGVAWGVRSLNLGLMPRTLHNDEAIMAVSAVRLLQEPVADPALIDTQGYVNLWYYTLALSIRLFGETIAGVRTLPALLGVLTIPAAYLLFRCLFERRIAMVASILLATFHFHIHFSRLALNNVADPLLGALIFTCLVLGWRTQRYTLFALAGVWLGLGLYLYTGARLFFVLIASMGLLWLLARRSSWRAWPSSTYLGPLLILSLGVLLVAAPIVQNILLNPDPFTTRFRRDGLSFTKIQQFAAEQAVTPARFLVEQAKHAALAFHYYPDKDVGAFYDKERPLLGVVPGVLMGVGVGVCCHRWRRWRFQLPLVWLALAVLLGGVLMVRPPSVQRYITLAPVLCLLIALGIDLLYRAATRLLPHRERWWRLAVVLLVSYVAADSLQQYFGDYRRRETYGTLQSQAATMLAQHLASYPTTPTVVYVGERTQPYLRSHIPRYLLGDYFRFGLPDIAKLETVEKQISYSLPAGNSCVVFVARPAHQADLQAIEQRRPQGQSILIRWPLTGAPLFHLYAWGCQRAGQVSRLSAQPSALAPSTLPD